MNNEMSVVLGTVAMEPKGEWDSSVYYYKLNTVIYNDSTYMAIQSSNNVLPTNTEYWQYIGGGVTKESSIITFNNVAEMKAATNLKNEYTLQTLGYYAANDGGGATYKVSNTASVNEYREELENGLYANLIVKNEMCPEQFGAKGDELTDDTIAIQNAIKYGNVCVFSKKYNIGNSTINIDKPTKLQGIGDNLIIASSYQNDETPTYQSIFYVDSENVIIENINFQSVNDKAPYIDVNAGISEINGVASNRIAIEINKSNVVLNNIYCEKMGIIRLTGYANDVLIENIRGEFIENGIYAPQSKRIEVDNFDVSISKDLLSNLYHIFYFCKGEDCIFNNIKARANGIADYINSDIFHFNFANGGIGGGNIIVSNVIVEDNCFEKLAQINTDIKAIFSNCKGIFNKQICLLSGNAQATFNNCDFEITTGDSSIYALRGSTSANRIKLFSCSIKDNSDGYLFSDGVECYNCKFNLERMVVRNYNKSKYVRFNNCYFKANLLSGFVPNDTTFNAYYNACVFDFDTTSEYPVSTSNNGGLVLLNCVLNNCTRVYTGEDTNKFIDVIYSNVSNVYKKFTYNIT